MKPTSKILTLNILLTTASAALSNWDISSCSDESTIIYAESNERHIVSKNYPSTIPEGESNCVYSLQGRSDDTIISVEFKDFSLTSSGNCQQEKILIEEEGGKTVGPFCGANSPKVYTSKSPTLKVRFIKSGGPGKSFFAFGFKGMSREQMRQANSAFAAFDKRKQGPRSPLGGYRGGRPGNSFSPTQQNQRIAQSFDSLRRPPQVTLKSSVNAASATPQRAFEQPVIASTGIRLGAPGGGQGQGQNPNTQPATRAADTAPENTEPNSHLKSIGYSSVRGLPSRVGQKKMTAKRVKPVTSIRVNNTPDIRSSVVPQNRNEAVDNRQVITKTYTSQQEVDNEINAIYNSNGYLHEVQDVQTSRNQKPVSFLSTADAKSEIVLSDAFIPSSFIARSDKPDPDQRQFVLADSSILSDLKNRSNNQLNDPIGDFFRNWTVTKSFIAALVGLVVLLIFTAFCRYKCNKWMKSRQEQHDAKLQEATNSQPTAIIKSSSKLFTQNSIIVHPNSHVVDVTGQTTHSHAHLHANNGAHAKELPGSQESLKLPGADYPPTYKSVMKNLMVRKLKNHEQSNINGKLVDDDADTEIAPSSVKTSKTYVPAVTLPLPNVEHSQCSDGSPNSQARYGTLDSLANASYVDPNGVNPVLEREKSRKKFGERPPPTYEQDCNSSASDLQSFQRELPPIGVPRSSVLSTHSYQPAPVLPQRSQLPRNLTMSNTEADAALKKIQKELKMRKKIQKLGSGRY